MKKVSEESERRAISHNKSRIRLVLKERAGRLQHSVSCSFG